MDFNNQREQEDMEFMPIRAAAKRKGAGFFSHILLGTIIAFFLVFLTWASLTKLDEVTRGQGKVIPSSSIQIIDNLEGGIVSEILIKDGDLVEKGQVLLKIDNIMAEADLKEAQKRIAGFDIQRIRLEAELHKKDLVFPENYMKKFPSSVLAETKLYTSRQAKINQQIVGLESQVQQKNQEIAELERNIQRLSSSEKLAREQLHITRPLAKKGAISRVELIQRERDYNDIKGELETTKLSLPRALSARDEAKSMVSEQIATYNQEVSQKLSEVRFELQTLQEKIIANEDRVKRTDVRSPVNGVIKQLLVNTVGGVIQAGEDLIEIVPIDDRLKIRAEIKPSDIAFLKPGLGATIKITAYDFSIYGGLDATVTDISVDTIEDDEKQEFYYVTLISDTNYLGRADKKLPIIPGMTASVDILTGKKSVLDYLLKPILKAKNNALTER